MLLRGVTFGLLLEEYFFVFTLEKVKITLKRGRKASSNQLLSEQYFKRPFSKCNDF